MTQPVLGVVRWLGIAGLGLAGAACGGASPPQAAAGADLGGGGVPARPLFLERERTTTFGRFWVSYRTDPSPVPLSESFALDVTVAEAADHTRPADVELAWITAEMPAHSHGMNVEPAVRKVGPGRFVVDGMLLHMLGHWTLNVDLAHRGITERAAFDVVLQ